MIIYTRIEGRPVDPLSLAISGGRYADDGFYSAEEALAFMRGFVRAAAILGVPRAHIVFEPGNDSGHCPALEMKGDELDEEAVERWFSTRR